MSHGMYYSLTDIINYVEIGFERSKRSSVGRPREKRPLSLKADIACNVIKTLC